MPVNFNKRKLQPTLDKLPNAPLVEVVLELHWELVGNPPFLTDPGILPLIDSFTSGVRKLGFSQSKDMANPQDTVGHGVIKRFYRGADAGFPILQIGHGVFAVNESSQYEWSKFKKLSLDGLKIFLQSYPKLRGFPLRAKHLELRYIDSFDKSVMGTLDLVTFSQNATALGIVLPPMLVDPKRFSGDCGGRIILRRDVKSQKDTAFIIDLGSGRNNDKNTDIVRLETKVVSGKNGIPNLSSPASFLAGMNKWLDLAHGLTSPFFKDFVRPEVMRQFES